MTFLKPRSLTASSLKKKVALALVMPFLFVLRLAVKVPVNVSDLSIKFKSLKAPMTLAMSENALESFADMIGLCFCSHLFLAADW